MSAQQDVTLQQPGLDVVEAPFWAPPDAPLDMPQQVLERVRRPPLRLWSLLTPRLRA